MLPKAVNQNFKLEWQPILMNMDQDPGLLIPPYTPEINPEVIETNFSISDEHLKRMVCSFLWDKQNGIIENWSVASSS